MIGISESTYIELRSVLMKVIAETEEEEKMAD
jgi:hypothetical protein